MKNVLFVLLASLVTSAAFADDAARLAPLTEITLADGRDIVATAEGMAVYTFDIDENGVSNCYGGCAKAWPPVLVKSANGLQAPMGVTTRKDGALQLTVNGQPVYLFVGDTAAGEINGDGLDDVWHIIID